MNFKEEKEKSRGISSPPKGVEDFETAARILSSLGIEGITFYSATLRELLSQTFPGLPEAQVERLVKIFSKNGENKNERDSR